MHPPPKCRNHALLNAHWENNPKDGIMISSANNRKEKQMRRIACVGLALCALLGCGHETGTPSSSETANPNTAAPAKTAAPPILRVTGESALKQLEKELETIAIRPPAGMPRNDEMSQLLDEISGLRNDLRLFRASMEMYLGASESIARQDRAQLLIHMQQLAARLREQDAPPAAFQSPDAVSAHPYAAPSGATPTAGENIALASVGGLRYAVVKEWETPPGKPNGEYSAKGMICIAPGNSSERDLAALGRSLAQQYDRYDTMTIDVFDSMEPARRYAADGSDAPDRRLLQIIKKTGERPKILLHPGENAAEIPLEDNAPPTPSPHESGAS